MKKKVTAGFEPVDTFARSDEKMQSNFQRFTGAVSRAPEAIINTIRVPTAEVQEQERREPTTTDPDDPHNWPAWNKHLTYGTICLFSFMANVNASVFTVAVRPLSLYFHISTTLATAMTSLNVLMFGLGNILWVPLMRVIGKRPVYLLAIALMFATNAWSAKATSWGSLLAARMTSGVGASAADATVPSVVADLYSHGERAHFTMFFHLALASGIFLGPLINAWVIQLHGWRWALGWMAIIFGFLFLLAIFTIHETEYRKDRRALPTTTTTTPSGNLLPRKSFISHLSLTNGLQRHKPLKSFTRCLIDILTMLSYPLILWPSFLVGVIVGWTIIIQITAGQTLTLPPYRFTIGKVGLFHLAGFIGVLLSVPFGGFMVDWIVKFSVRNKEREEAKRANPKKRLLALVVPGLIAPAGLLVYGFQLAAKKAWIGPAFGYAMHSFGFASISNIVVVYAIDAYQTSAPEAFVSLFVIRNIIAVICSFETAEWTAKVGLKAQFGTMAGIEWSILLLGIMVYFYSPKLLMVSGRYGPEKRRREEGGEGRLSGRGEELRTMDNTNLPDNQARNA